jgi:choline dehydrogenase-like flavoprotein
MASRYGIPDGSALADWPIGYLADPYGRVWDHPNLRVIDGSRHITNGGVNPVLTIFANAFRIMHTLVGSGRDYLEPPVRLRKATSMTFAARG